MSRAAVGVMPGQIIGPPQGESKRDRKRREIINKVEKLHDDSWNSRDESDLSHNGTNES